MILNYLKVTLRNLLKQKQSNFLNITALAFGLACCAACYLHIRYELEYDQYNENFADIHRVVAGNPNESEYWTKIAAPMPAVFKEQVPEIKAYTRFSEASYNPKVLVQIGTRSLLEPYFMMADPAFFQIFTFKTISGNAYKALEDLNSVVITQSIAKKLFGEEDPLGKLISLKEKEGLDFQVGAVIADLPSQAHFKFDYLISFENLDRLLGEGKSDSWGAYNYYCYLQLNRDVDRSIVERKIQEAKLTLPDSRQVTFEQIFLQPLGNIHFQDSRGNQLPSYDKTYIYVFVTIALGLLLVACINYLNLSIALSIKRIKEIGVRKAVGASRSQLVFQFINESIVTSFIALAFGLILLESLIPIINSLFGSTIATNYLDFEFLSFTIGITLLVGLFSGSYLSFYVNGYKTSAILKGTASRGHKGQSLQQGLVFLQFSISIVLIISSFIISNQMNFLQEKNLGFDHNELLSVPINSSVSKSQVEELKNQLKQSPQVIEVAASSFTPGTANWNNTVWWEGQQEPVSMFIITVDRDFLATMDINLIEGDHEKIMLSDNPQYIINESALSQIGWESAVGRQFTAFGDAHKEAIAGVVENFNFMSLHHAVEPLVLSISDRHALDQLTVRVEGSSLTESVAVVEAAYKKVLGDLPFEFSFMDDNINNLYESETRVNKIVSYLSIVAIGFALFGVYGLISLSIENKTKEIAIRKVLGITTKDLIVLFSKTYYRLMGLSFLIAVPIVWYLLKEWLNKFSYRVEINPLWFAFAFAGVMICITMIGVFKHISLTKINPAQALKNE